VPIINKYYISKQGICTVYPVALNSSKIKNSDISIENKRRQKPAKIIA
jgi:hypothetical protein